MGDNAPPAAPVNPLDALLGVNGELVGFPEGDGNGQRTNEEQAQICTDFLAQNPEFIVPFDNLLAGSQLIWALLDTEDSRRAYLQATTAQRETPSATLQTSGPG